MELELEKINKIAEAIQESRKNFPSDAKHANYLGVAASVYNRIKKGERERVLDSGKWINIARLLDVELNDTLVLKTAETSVYIYMTEQFSICQNESISTIYCDMHDIGKTHSAKVYASTHKNAVRIDCTQAKNKQRLVRNIARAFGVNSTGKYFDMYEDLCYYLRSIYKPLVILDDAGDLSYEAVLELKALWNATENCCGWYMIGTSALAKKLERWSELEKVGSAETISRYGGINTGITPKSAAERVKFIEKNIAAIVKANVPTGTDIRPLVYDAKGSMRRIRTVIKKFVV